ncbi:MAG: response regulator [Proteobacteria bacterium]|nr:MAG: response regulator [Pseudomonadota bacterium]PIE17445.1 MAG: response regulator [Pseudomonadota bacterium]
MITLIAEDDFTSRLLLEQLLRPYGEVHLAENGEAAVEATRAALATEQHFDLICLDIMMPLMDGQQALVQIRELEYRAGLLNSQAARVLMTTALSDHKNVMRAFREQCDGYLTKPIDKRALLEQLDKLGLAEGVRDGTR